MFEPFFTTKIEGMGLGPFHLSINCRSAWWPPMGVGAKSWARRLSFIAALSGNVTEELTSALGQTLLTHSALLRSMSAVPSIVLQNSR